MELFGYEVVDYVYRAIKDLKFKDFTLIQKKVFDKITSNKNIIAQSKTGSGKTLAFLIPIFNNLDVNLKECQAVICAPTTELALQIKKVANYVASFSSEAIDIRCYVGGTDRKREIERLTKSQPQIIIGTPGKIKDLVVDENILKIHNAKYFVVDEVDMTCDAGFIDELDYIAFKFQQAKMMFFSATINQQIEPFLRKYIELHDYIKVEEDLDTLKIEHILIPVKERDKYVLLNNLLKSFHPYLALIFCNTKQTVKEVANFLKKENYLAAELSGDLDARERRRVLRDIEALKYQYVVCSDIAARGIDIQGVSHVINFELPKDSEFYIHRSGRTGRMNLDGVCISLYDLKDDSYLNSLEDKKINFIYKDIKNQELVDYKGRNLREKRVRPLKEEERKAIKLVKKPKKVTPGYKKKMKEKQKEITKTLIEKNRKTKKRWYK